MTWIETYTHKRVDLTDPDSAEINVVDIAHSLAHQCRFAGHTRKHYSVAEHSILVALVTPAPYKLHGLLHDAAEAYLQDITRPLKALLPEYSALEARWEQRIFSHFGLAYPLPDVVTEADNALLARERTVVMQAQHDWELEVEPADVQIHCMPAKEAKQDWLEVFYALTTGSRWGMAA